MEKVYLKITNDGEVDVNAFRLLGASSKEEDKTKIGFFGSGLKYAIALLLREGIDFKVFSGKKEIKIGTRTTKMRGENYSVITINGTPTSMTTRMGKDWELWFALREIYCNALDENGAKVSVSNEVVGQDNETGFYVEFNDALREIWKNRNNYFSFDRNVVFQNEVAKLYEPTDNKLKVYRKGILVCERDKKSLFDYNFDQIEINESRVVISDFELEWKLISFWKKLKNKEIISRLFKIGAEDSFEFDLKWSYGTAYFSNDWLEAMNNRVIVPKEYAGNFIDDLSGDYVELPFNLCEELKKYFGNKVRIRGIDGANKEYTELEKTVKQEFLLKESLAFLENVGIKINYEIKIGKFKSSLFGMVDVDKIILSDKVFEKGRREIVATLIEELAHIEADSGDRTRGFQDYLIDKYIAVLEDKVKQYL